MAAPHPAAPEIRALSRRRFLKTALVVSAAGAAVLGGTFAFLARSPKDKLPKPAGIQALSDSEYHLFAAVCAVSLPGEGNAQGLVPWTQLPVLANIDRLIAGVPAHARGDVTKAFGLFDNAAIVSGWHGKRFVDLPPAEALAYLAAWGEGNKIQRAISNLVRKVAYISYWREAGTWPAIGFDGPVLEKWGLERYGNAPLPVLAGSAVPASAGSGNGAGDAAAHAVNEGA